MRRDEHVGGDAAVGRTTAPATASRRPSSRRREALRRGRRGRRRQLRRRAPRVLLAAGPERMRQDDDAADARRVRDADRGPHPGGGPRRLPPGAARAGHEHGVPALRAVPAHDRGAERGVRSAAQEALAQGGRAARRASPSTAVRLEGYGEAVSARALGRPAATRRARSRAREPPGGAAARRAARRARPQAARGDAVRAQAHPARGRHQLRLRHPRPGRGPDDVAIASPS